MIQTFLFSINSGRMELKYLRQANSEVISELIIKRVESQDYGTYVCKATNKMGNTEQLIELLGRSISNTTALERLKPMIHDLTRWMRHV